MVMGGKPTYRDGSRVMMPLVTVGIPVYKRLNFLPLSLASVEAQDYPHIECLISDNGLNGTQVEDIAARHYAKLFRVRKNCVTVGQSEHYNQIAKDASGKYFLLLNDDDEISPNLVSELVSLLERYPAAAVAIPKEETMDLSGRTMRGSADVVPELMSGEEFVRAWCRGIYRYETFTTILTRREAVVTCGGYPSFPTGNGIDDALLAKLCLGNQVALTARCVFRKRTDEGSLGFSCDYRALTKAARGFLSFLRVDPTIQRYALAYPTRWLEVNDLLVKMIWKTCFERWNGMYRARLSVIGWVRAAFTMPYVPDYYVAVGATLVDAFKAAVFDAGKKLFPWAHRLCSRNRNAP